MPLRFLHILGLCAAIFLVCASIQLLARLAHIPLDLTANKGAGQALLYVIVLLGAKFFALWVWKPRTGPSWSMYWQSRRVALRGFGLTTAFTLAAQILLYSLLLVTGDSRLNLHSLNAKIALGTVSALLIVPILAATEETIFRAFIFQYLRGTQKPIAWGATCGSALLFALSHQFHGLLDWLQPQSYSLLAGLFLLGVLLAVVYQATGSLTCSIGVHAALVWLDVFRKRTDLVQIHQTQWWMGTNNDLRTAPVIWLLFLLLTYGFWQSRHWLAPRTQVEKSSA